VDKLPAYVQTGLGPQWGQVTFAGIIAGNIYGGRERPWAHM